MNKFKLSNPVRLIAFFLTAVVLICTFGFTVDGWQIGNYYSNNEQQGPFSPPDNEENTETNSPSEPEIYIPEFVNRLTGIEISEEEATRAHFAFILNPTLSTYGLSRADLICEIPTEDGERLVAFISDIENLSKIGSISQTRGYISNVAKYFGGISTFSGCDDAISYTSCDLTSRQFDLTEGGYFYTEYTNNVYSNSDLINRGIKDLGIDCNTVDKASLPFNFVDFGCDPIMYDELSAQSITINRENSSYTELRYNSESGEYILYKNGLIKVDALNAKPVIFANCFVLFADSITYDNTECSQMVMDTIGQGKGYYFTAGGVIEISWIGTEEGALSFYTSDGERLTVNRGKTFISFVKSSKTDSVYVE